MQTNSKKTTEAHPQFSELFRKQGEPNKWYYRVQRGDTIEKINQRFFQQEERQPYEKLAKPNHKNPIDNREYWEPLFVGEELCIIVEPFVAIEVTELSQPYTESELSINEAEQALLDLANPIDYQNHINDLNILYHYASQYMLRNDITDKKSVSSLEMVTIFIKVIENCATTKM